METNEALRIIGAYAAGGLIGLVVACVIIWACTEIEFRIWNKRERVRYTKLFDSAVNDGNSFSSIEPGTLKATPESMAILQMDLARIDSTEDESEKLAALQKINDDIIKAKWGKS
jgi:hypothetical protein